MMDEVARAEARPEMLENCHTTRYRSTTNLANFGLCSYTYSSIIDVVYYNKAQNEFLYLSVADKVMKWKF